MSKVRPIAIYMPQFHPIPENDEWWGKGFTEWTNVVKAKSRFWGHYQPHLPADLGFYDLRLPETRQAQVDLARQYGVQGFCYYHYWFNGRRMLERPFEEVFQSGQPDFPFMLCWANENWTRIWDGGDQFILLNQEYSRADSIAHIRSLIPYFQDERYIRVQGRPIFAIYRSALLPDVDETVQIFRDECAKQGIDLYLCRFGQKADKAAFANPTSPFDAEIEFQPLSYSYYHFQREHWTRPINRYLDSKRYKRFVPQRTLREWLKIDRRYSYEEFVRFDLNFDQEKQGFKMFPGICPGWDNSSRREGQIATILSGSTPDLFRQWVAGKIANFQPFGPEENFLFINAWNEWAEGNHLEPCQKWGRGYLEALQAGLQE